MASDIKAKVVILGMDHHNALNVARQLSLAGLKPYGIIVYSGRLPKLKWSRYWKKCHYISSEKEGIELALQKYGDIENRAVIITCTDKFAKIVDENLHMLSEFFICPGVDEQGKLTDMMDKMWQYNFAVEHNILVAPTVSVELNDIDGAFTTIKRENIESPYIVKPRVSAEGNKSDIRICGTESELKRNLEEFQRKGYKDVIVQNLVEYDYEMLVVGACFIHKEENMFILNKLHRVYPPKRGTGCYRENIVESSLNAEANRIIQELRSTGYHGLVDIELFYKNGQVILNELNLRSSGASFIGTSEGYLYAFYYVMDALGFKLDIPEQPRYSFFSMTEYSDIRYPLYYKYGWRKWMREFRKVSNYAYLHWDDPAPMIFIYIRILLFIITRKEW